MRVIPGPAGRYPGRNGQHITPSAAKRHLPIDISSFFLYAVGPLGTISSRPRKIKERKAYMPDYQMMYHILCAAASRALDELPEAEDTFSGRKVLQDALYEAEELYIRSGETQ